LAEFTECSNAKIETALKRVRKAIKEGAAKLEACAGMDKLKEALGDIETKMRFSLNNPALPEAPLLATVPESLPAEFRVEAAVKPVRDFFGLNTCSLDRARALQAEWARHREAVRSQHASRLDALRRTSATVTPRPPRIGPSETMAYYQSSKASLPDLSKAVIPRLLHPNGNAAAGRFMNIISDMDTRKAQSTKRGTLYNVAFIRGNAPIARLLLAKMAAELKAAEVGVGHAAKAKAEREAAAEAERLTKTLAALMEAAFDAAERRASMSVKRRFLASSVEGEEEEEEEEEEREEEEDDK